MMEYQPPKEQDFWEACSYGDIKQVESLIESGVDINSPHPINKWTGLHWACKRNHKDVVRHLILSGADANLYTAQNELPANLTRDPEILQLLGAEYSETDDNLSGEVFIPQQSNGIKFTPNYLINPVRIQSSKLSNKTIADELQGTNSVIDSPEKLTSINPEIVVKIRIADTGDPDFIEVELLKTTLTYGSLLTICCQELNVSPQLVERIRKLPNTRLRNDKDVLRLQDFQELELLVKGTSKRIPQMSSKSSGAMPNFQNQTILY